MDSHLLLLPRKSFCRHVNLYNRLIKSAQGSISLSASDFYDRVFASAFMIQRDDFHIDGWINRLYNEVEGLEISSLPVSIIVAELAVIFNSINWLNQDELPGVQYDMEDVLHMHIQSGGISETDDWKTPQFLRAALQRFSETVNKFAFEYQEKTILELGHTLSQLNGIFQLVLFSFLEFRRKNNDNSTRGTQKNA